MNQAQVNARYVEMLRLQASLIEGMGEASDAGDFGEADRLRILAEDCNSELSLLDWGPTWQ